MRSLWLAITFSVCSLIVYTDNDPYLGQFRQFLASQYGSLMYDRQINLSTDGVLNPEEIRSQIALTSSNLDWLFDQHEVLRELLVHPRVQSAEISRCTETWWGCFEVRVTEHQPRYLALAGNSIWIGSQEGELLEQVSSDNQQRIAYWFLKRAAEQKVAAGSAEVAAARLEPVRVTGLTSAGGSPAIAQQRLRYQARAVSLFEQLVGPKVVAVTIEENGALTFQIEPERFQIKFSPSALLMEQELSAAALLAETDIETEVNAQINADSFLEELKRAKALLAELGPTRLARVAEIDLAFDSVGVIKLKGQ